MTAPEKPDSAAAKFRGAMLKRLIELADDPVGPQQTASGGARFIANASSSIWFTDEQALRLEQVVADLVGYRDWGLRFSEKYMKKAVENMLLTFKNEKTHKIRADKFSRLWSDLSDYSTEQVVHVPVAGLKMNVDTLSVGDVLLRRMDDQERGDLALKITKILDQSSSPESARKFLSETVIPKFIAALGNTLAVFTVVAEPQRARERAQAATRAAIDLFRYAIPSVYDRSHRVLIGFPHEVFRTVVHTPVVTSDWKSVELNTEVMGILQPFDLDKQRTDHLRKIGFFTMSDVLGKPPKERSSFERILLIALRWFGDALSQELPENQLLSLITSLETLLGPQDGRPIRSSISESAALLTATDIDGRDETKSWLMKMYDKRSKISHAGSKAVLDSEVTRLTNLCGNVLMRLILAKEQFVSKSALLERLDRARMSAPLDF